MKLEMGDEKHAWITFNGTGLRENEVIIDRQRNDIRVRIGNSIVKIQHDRKEVKGILLDDIYCFKKGVLEPRPSSRVA